MFSTVDWRIVLRGGATGAVCLVAAGLLGGPIAGTDPASWWSWLFLGIALIAFGLAGYVAGRARRDVPMIHGALAAVVTATVAGAVGVARQLADGAGVNPFIVAVTGVLAVTCGVAGGLLADWEDRRRRRRRAGSPEAGSGDGRPASGRRLGNLGESAG